jgi:drug/metabolite transporter (DMT)-like permease
VACVLYRRMLTAALSIFTAAGGLSVAAAKKTLGPRISVFVVVVNIVRSVVNIVVWGLDNSSEGEDSFSNSKHRGRAGGAGLAGLLQMLYHSGYLLYIVPVVMFTVSDTVAFMSLSRLNPATFSLIWNCKTAFVAVLFRFFIKRQPMAWHKWLGVALLLLGPGTAEAGNLWHARQTLVGGGLYELNPVAVYKLNPPVAVYKLNPGAVCTS